MSNQKKRGLSARSCLNGNGLIHLIRHGYGVEIALSPQDAQEVWRLLDAYLERRAYEWAASYGSAPGGKE